MTVVVAIAIAYPLSVGRYNGKDWVGPWIPISHFPLAQAHCFCWKFQLHFNGISKFCVVAPALRLRLS